MQHFLRILLSSALGLTAVTVMGVSVQAPAATPHRWVGDSSSVTREGVTGQGDWVQRQPEMRAVPPGAFILAQNTGTLKEKPASPAPSPEEPQKLRKRAAPPPSQMERHDSKSPGIGDEPERAGTKKLGGQIIRSKEGSGGE